MFVFLIVMAALAGVYLAMPPWWQSASIAGAIAIMAVALGVFLINVIREQVVFASRPTMPAGFTWLVSQTALDFQLSLLSYLRRTRWKVLSSTVSGPARVAFVLQSQHRCVVLICLATETGVRDEDFRQAAKWRSDYQADDAIIVMAGDRTAPVHAPLDERSVKLVHYEWLGEFQFLQL